MRFRRRAWMPVLAVLAVLAAACAAEQAVTEPGGEAVPEPVAEQAEASEPDTTPAAEETEPADAAAETAPEAEPESAPTTIEAETEAEPESAPTTIEAETETEPESAPTTSSAAEAEPAPTTSTAANPESETAPTTSTAPNPEPEPAPTTSAAAETEPEAEPAPTTSAAPEPQPSSGVAAVLALVDALTVAAEQTGGYDRDLFRHWVDADGDGCDTRREVLIAEAVVAPTQGSRCALSDGEWISRYDGLTEQGSGRGFDVDHLVPLAEAWASGAHGWLPDRRERYANDLGYEQSLIAVSARSNRSKGAQDPATWLPPEADQHCWYAAAWVHVKTRWSLTVDTAEANTLRGVLSGCSQAALDVGLPAAVVEAPTTTVAPTTTTTIDDHDDHRAAHHYTGTRDGLPPRLHAVPPQPARRRPELRRPHRRPEARHRQRNRCRPLPARPRPQRSRLYQLSPPMAATRSGR